MKRENLVEILTHLQVVLTSSAFSDGNWWHNQSVGGANHFNICKFGSSEDITYVGVKLLLSDILSEMSSSSRNDQCK